MFRGDVDLLVVPPVQSYLTLDFHLTEEILRKGYNFATALLPSWKRRALNEGGPQALLLRYLDHVSGRSSDL